MLRALGVVSFLAISGCTDDIVEPDAQGVQRDEPLLSEDALVIDFGVDGENRWVAVNDTVMGGVSNGEVDYTDNELIFDGVVSTDSNGGFTSVQSPDETLNLRNYDRVVIRMKNVGQPFSMVLANNPYWFQDQFRADIEVPDEEWNIVEIELADFEEVTLTSGYPTPTGATMKRRDRKEILGLEFMSELFEDGPFRLEVDFVAFD